MAERDSNQLQRPKFKRQFLMPRYWGTWLLCLVLYVLTWLPRRWVMVLGKWLGNQFGQRNVKRRKIAETNLSLCFPDLTPQQRSDFLNRHFQAYGCSILDMGLAFWASKNRINRLMTVEGIGHIESTVKSEPLLLVNYHLTTMEMLVTQVLPLYPTVSMMNFDKNPILTWLQYRGRKRFGDLKLVMRQEGLKPLISGMKEGRICIYFPDEDFGEARHSEYVTFFGVEAARLNTVSRLAKIGRAAVILGVGFLDVESGKYNCVFSPPVEGLTGDTLADTALINEKMEQLIRQAPEQYLWTFRWFKTRPGGQGNPYEIIDQ